MPAVLEREGVRPPFRSLALEHRLVFGDVW